MSAAFKVYIFQPSKIWEAGNPVDPSAKPVRVVAKNEIRARKKLPMQLGRTWILISTHDKNKGV